MTTTTTARDFRSHEGSATGQAIGRTPRGFTGFKQLSVAAAESTSLDDAAFANCLECESLVLYEPSWPELPRICRKCFSRRQRE